MIDFTTLTAPKSPNFYLLCPHAYCHATPHATSPIFRISMQQLKTQCLNILNTLSRTTLTNENEVAQQYTYEQRSLLFRFPDTIHIQFILLSQTETTLAVFSHSNYGYYDFGVNKRRVNRIIHTLQQHLNKSV